MKEKHLNIALAILRLSLGLSFVIHGVDKIVRYEMVSEMFSGMGIPTIITIIVIIVELLAGLFILGGIFTRVSGIAIAVIMFAAFVMVKFQLGFVGGYETDIAFFAMAVALALTGPGKYALQSYFKKA